MIAAIGSNAVSSATSVASTKVTKDEFLRLLVAQLQNQDPLSPMKNEDFLTQLATFSSLEQLIDIKDALDDLVTATERKDGTQLEGPISSTR